MAEPLETLHHMLAPQGIKTVTTGGDEIGRFLEAHYGSTNADEVDEVWRGRLRALANARVAILGVPMDAGAGFERGSFKGPLGIRTALHAHDVYPALEAAGVVDIGDVRVNPHLIDDTYYQAKLLDAVRSARNVPAGLPVSPHSAFRTALEAIRQLNPDIRVIHLGGDHSTSRIPVEWLTANDRNTSKDLGILHFDAHTDLLSERDGVPHNFATWAYHANDAIGRGRRLVQLGIRVSGRSAEEWEQDLDLVQIRAPEINAAPIESTISRVMQTFRDAGVHRLYISNDIDGTDPTFAAATGTMEPDGLTPEFVTETIRAAGKEFEVVAADVVEVAPPLKWHVPGEPARTIATACRYLVDTVEAMLGQRVTTAFDRLVPASREAVTRAPGYVGPTGE
jgi:agmatinase